ncbi:MAG TPA: hypothetical protein VGM64_01240 [Lacunisphaera sp.]|jgi:hypothetical protein
MSLRPFIIVLVSASMAIQLWGADAAAAPAKMDLSGLVNNSPFGTLRSGGAGGNASTEPFEFRAILEENNNKFFSIYETATRRSNWVELNDPVNGFSIKSYDAGKQAITVDYQGKAMTLAIKQAPAVAQVYQAPPPQTGPVPVMQTPGNPSLQAGPTMPTAIDQQRIQQIQEEIRRRRALRNQAIVPNVNSQGGQPHYGEGPRPQPSNSSGPQLIPPRN